MVKILGLGDIFAAIILFASITNPPLIIIIFTAGYLLIKAFLFLFDIGTAMDIAAGLLLIISLFVNLHPLPLCIFSILIGIKGILSLFA